MKLLLRAKFDYYGNINLGKLADNRKFWNTVKPLFSDQGQVGSFVSLIKGGKIESQDSQIAEIFNPLGGIDAIWHR